MPDIHWGYGFCIGGVCATDPAEGGVISPGGVGYDINCGVRLVRTNLFLDDVKPHIRELVEGAVLHHPAGRGPSGQVQVRRHRERAGSWARGRSFVIDRGLGVPRDLEHTEANGRIDDGRPARGLRSRGQARLGAVRHARQRATTSSKCRSSIASSTRTWRRCSAWNRTRSA